MTMKRSSRICPCFTTFEHLWDPYAQIVTLVEEAASRLEPYEDGSGGGGGGFTEDAFISVGGAIAAIGSDLRDRISHALGGTSLEELVEHHRTDMSGLQVRTQWG